MITTHFPIVLPAAVLAHRSIHPNIRRQGGFRWPTPATVAARTFDLGHRHRSSGEGLASLGAAAWTTCTIAIVGHPFTLLAAVDAAAAEAVAGAL